MAIPFDARWHLRIELRRLAGQLARALAQARQRGRGAMAEAMGGMVVEDGEADGLVASLLSEEALAGAAGADDGDQQREDAAALQGAWLPLRHARAAFALDGGDYLALLLAIAVELDGRFARLVAYLNDHAGRTRPTLALAQSLAAATGADFDLSRVHARPLLADGLLELDGDGPLPALALRLAPGTAARFAHGVDADLPDWAQVRREDSARLERVVLGERERRAVSAWAAHLRGGRLPPPLLLVGGAGSGRATVAAAAAGAAGLPLVIVDLADGAPQRLRLARREGRWHRAAILVRADQAATDWSALWRLAETVQLPLALAVASDLRTAALAAAKHQPVEVPCGSFAIGERVQLWQRLLPPGDSIAEPELAPLASRFHCSPAAMARAVRRAQADAAAAPVGQRRLSASGLATAVRALSADSLGALAQRLDSPYQRADLVVPEAIGRELDLAKAWVRTGRTVLDDWGLGRRVPYGRGLTALFGGPPGTGKTMAAQVLAHELGLDLYRVDLSQVVNKYIGETEKNLGRLFDLAAQSDAALFFDEADALFGKRSEVKDAHDRYANLEVGYLLQRMEAHQGVTILATNRAADLDEAFVRRFQVVIDFPRPGQPERLRIWQGLLAPSMPRSPDVDLPALARAFELSGGEIKNCVLAAAFLAAGAGEVVGMAQLVAAIRRELLKNGRVVDERACAVLMAPRAARAHG